MMPSEIGNTKVYSRKEVEKATLFGKNTVLGFFKSGKIKAQKNDQGYYQVVHGDLVDYLVNEQDIPKDIVDRIIDYRISNSNLANCNK